MKKAIQLLKDEIVTLISFVLALVSTIITRNTKELISYIDFRTLALLFCLMVVMAGLNRLGVFEGVARLMLRSAGDFRRLSLLLVLLCFFASMVITNDVALIIFVPFTIITLTLAKKRDKLIYIVVLETIAANLGSMLTPVGNPQNLYLFTTFNMSIGDFFVTIIPYATLSLVCLIVCSLLSGKGKIKRSESRKIEWDKRLICLYAVLFVVAMLAVFRVLNYLICFGIVLAVVLIFDRKTLARVDYSLLLTFVFLFIFIGNLGSIDSVSNYLRGVVDGNEVLAGVVLSQVFSNVPTAILLSGFTDNAKELLIGVNLGGLGTLIASMASLISFKLIAKEKVNMPKYLAVFTIMNVAFLAVNVGLRLVIGII